MHEPDRAEPLPRQRPRWSELRPLVKVAVPGPPIEPGPAGSEHRRAARSGASLHPARRVRLRGRSSRGRDCPTGAAAKPSTGWSSALRSCGTCPPPTRRHDTPRRPGDDAPGPRAHRLHAHDARGRGAAGVAAATRERHPLRPVHHGHGVDRGGRRGGPGRAALVPALPVEGGGTRPWSNGPRRQGTTPSSSPSTPRWPGRGCGMRATA